MTQLAMTEFKTPTALKTEIVRRTRTVLGARGYLDAGNIRICTNAVNKYRGLSFTESQLTECVDECADNTTYFNIEYV